MFKFNLIAILLFSLHAQAKPVDLKANKKTVEAFYDLAFNQHKAVDAAMKYLKPEYKQHNPHVADGRQAFIDAFKTPDPKELESKTIFKRLIAEEDLVVLHSHKIRHKGDQGVAGIDIFRVESGMITEHWDVNQVIPEKSANQNTMF